LAIKKIQKMNALLSTAYWPNLHYFYYVINSETFVIEQFENYQKQSFRNRTQLLTANGKLDLTIPINKTKQTIKETEISYKENWQLNHWRAITSAYKNSPYFDFFEDEIYFFYNNNFKLLLEYNTEQLKLILKLLKLKKEILFSSDFEKTPKNYFDFRNTIHPKIEFTKDQNVITILNKPYYQTFENKFNFQPNLSMLDLLFNKGLDSLKYLNHNPV